jgi:hypothetical protein
MNVKRVRNFKWSNRYISRVIIFGLVFIYKKIKLKKKFETVPKPVQTDWFRFGLVF